jgi:hypothetical protein
MPKFHWLFQANHNDEFTIANSNLASARLRIFPCIKALSKNNLEVTFGQFISHQVRLIIIGKIGAQDINSRCKSWLSEISQAKSRGTSIVLDYTDHHLGFEGPMTQFYKSVVELVDHCIVPSSAMARLLSNFYDGSITIIEDAIEISPQSVKKSVTSISPTALWFGHASNINFLIDFINSSEFLMSGCNLIVLSNEQGLDIFSRSSLRLIDPQKIRLGLWSVESMLNAARIADFSIIPSNLSNPRKLGVSSNRLITSFALGLPTAADNLPSYQEFSDCYVDLRGPLFSKMVDRPLDFSNLTISAQSLYVDRFKPESIGQKWLDFLVSHQ